MPVVIAISGPIGSGKDTIADYLVRHHGFKRLAFASKVKDVAHVVFGWDRVLLEGLTAESRAWREVVDPFWGLSPRVALQRIGTEMFRTHIHPDTWVKTVVSQIVGEPDGKFVITDCRFENEVAAMKALGGRLVCVSRGDEPFWAASARAGAACPAEIHQTDWNVYRLQGMADVQVKNNGSLEELYEAVEKILSE